MLMAVLSNNPPAKDSRELWKHFWPRSCPCARML